MQAIAPMIFALTLAVAGVAAAVSPVAAATGPALSVSCAGGAH